MNSRVSAWAILLFAATIAAGQGGETRTTALAPPDKRAVPATPAEARRLIAQIDADRAALEELQRENPSSPRARAIQLLEEEIETIKRIELRRQERSSDAALLDRTSTASEELQKRLAQAGQDQEALPDPADPNAEVTLARERKITDDQLVEQLKRREDASGAKTKLELEQETDLRKVPVAKRALAEAQSDLTDFETDSREAAAGGVGAEQARVMGEQVYVYRLRVTEHQASLDALRFRAGDLDPMLADRASQEMALADATISRLEARRARIDTLAEKASESRLDRGKAEVASVAKTLAEVSPWAQPYWRLKLELAEIQVDVADASRKTRALAARTAPGGELAVLVADSAAESRSLAKVDAGKVEIEDVVPGTTQALLQFIERREAELAQVKNLQEEVRGLRKEAHERQRAARHDESAALADARRVEAPDGVEPAAGPEREAASPSAWEKLRSALKAASAQRAALLEEYDQQLGKTAEGLLAMRNSREMSLLRYKSALLWTRDPSEISVESIDRARTDLVAAPRAVAGAVKGAAQSSVDWVAGAASEGRVLDLVKVFGALLAAFALVFWVHKSAAKRFSATAGRDTLTLGRAAAVGGTLLRQVEWTALLAFAGVVLPMLAGASQQTIAVCAAVFVPPFAIRVARALIDLLFGSGPGERGLLGAPEALSRLLARTCILLVRVCACFVPLAVLLTVTGYRDRNPGVVELLWLLGSIGCYLVVLVVLLRPSGIGSVIRRKNQGSGRASFLSAVFAAAYPVVIAAVIYLLVLRSLSYRVAARYFLERFLISAAWIVGAMLLRRWLARILFGKEPRVAVPPADLASDPPRYEEQGRRALADRLRRALLTLVTFGPALFFVLDAWGLTGAGWDAAFNRRLRWISETVTLGNALSAVVTAALAFFIVRSARDLLRFVILPRTKLDTGVRYTIVTLTTYALVALSAIVILGGQLKVDAAVIGGFVAFLGLGLGFGLQEIVNNFFSGIILLVERPLKVGDTVTIGSTTGRVDRINMRSTMIMTAENTGVIVPNKDLISTSVTNWSAGTPTIRESLPLGVAYGTDTELFRKLVMEVVEGHGLVLKHPAIDLVFTGFGASSMDFALRYWIKLGTSGSKVKSDLHFALDAAFRKHGIEMPFPQHDVHVRTWAAKTPPPAPDPAQNGGVTEPSGAAAGAGE